MRGQPAAGKNHVHWAFLVSSNFVFLQSEFVVFIGDGVDGTVARKLGLFSFSPKTFLRDSLHAKTHAHNAWSSSSLCVFR